MNNFTQHWYEWGSTSNCTKDEALIHFEAGQQSRQDEIDELQKRIDEAVSKLKLVNHSLLYEHIDHIICGLNGEIND